MQHWELIFFFFLIAFVYSSVGFGGGSSYLALMSFYAMPFQELRLIALLCNVIVVAGGVYVFIKNKQLNTKKVMPLVLLSVPAAYLGATLKISQITFFIVLGCSLILAAILLWLQTITRKSLELNAKSNVVKDASIGGVIGFLSGMVGIGGGIFLSPILNLSGWDTAKKIAATASVFILANSISGIIGQATNLPETINVTRVLLLCVAVLIGGQLGSRVGALKFSPQVVKRVTAIVVFVAGVNVLLKHLPF